MSAAAAASHILTHGADVGLDDDPAKLARARTFHTMDLMRGIGAVGIVMFHAAFLYGFTPSEGQSAVDLFFVMSGFIIAYRYEADLHAGLGFVRFAKIRFVRLYPLYILGIVLGLIPALLALAAGVGNATHRGLVQSFPLAVVLLPSRAAEPAINELYPLNFVAWSLTLEFAVNMVYAASFRFWTKTRIAALLGLAFIAICVCAVRFDSLDGGDNWLNAPVGIVRAVYGFAIGLFIYRIYQVKPFKLRLPWWAIVAIAFAIFFYEPPWGRALYQIVALSIFAPLIVAASIANEPPKWMEKLCALAGLFSYVIYSLHAPLIGIFLRVEGHLHLDLQTQAWRGAIAFSILVAAVSYCAHAFYDKPIRRFLTKRWVWEGKSRTETAAMLRAAAKY